MIQVKSVEHLKELCGDDRKEFFIVLNAGAKSSKSVAMYGEKFDVYNDIDGTYQILSAKGLYKKSNIGEAIDKGAFYMYDD